jgi:hypothetical protein
MLKKSVTGVSESRQVADKDLDGEIDSASEAVQRITNGIASLMAQTYPDEEDGGFVDLVLATKRMKYDIATFLVAPNGYPVKVGSSKVAIEQGRYYESLRTREELKKYFIKLASNDSSRLVLRIAQILRTAKSADQEEAD